MNIRIYDSITKRIVTLLEKGTVPWHKPWKVTTGWPRNLVTNRLYRGVNVFLLMASSYESPFWLTFQQVCDLEGSVRQGEKSCPVLFWRRKTILDEETGEERTIPLLRLYHVFNVAQCDGVKEASLAGKPVDAVVVTKPVEIVEKMPRKPKVKHGVTKPWYSPQEDSISMPLQKRFGREEEYYSTLFHELIHATGHPTRLNRPTLTAKTGYGSNPYCKEELVAEMGAAFLCGHAEIVERTIDNSAAYIQGWLAQLKGDNTLVVQAAAQAQRAADFILGTLAEEAYRNGADGGTSSEPMAQEPTGAAA